MMKMIGEERQKMYEPFNEVAKAHKEAKHFWKETDHKGPTAGPTPRRSLKKKLHDWLKKKICGCNNAEERKDEAAGKKEERIPPQMYL